MSYIISDKLPKAFFVDTPTEKAKMLKKHLKDVGSNLVICANTGPNMSTFKFFKPQDEGSLELHFTLSNLGDQKDQLYSLWVQLNYMLKESCT